MPPNVPPDAPRCQSMPSDFVGHKKPAEPFSYAGLWTSSYNLRHVFGGEEEDRTPDLRIANATLSQLSYPPNAINSSRGPLDPARGVKTSPPPYLSGAPAKIHATTVRISASLIRGCDGIGIAPHTPAPPLRTTFSRCACASGLPLYFAAMSRYAGPTTLRSTWWQLAQAFAL